MTEKSVQRAANVAKAGLIVMFAFFILALTSCGSSCSKTKRYWRKHRCVEIENKKSINKARRALDEKVYSTQPQYAIINNEIIIFEN
jgi:hypothetical protein